MDTWEDKVLEPVKFAARANSATNEQARMT
jgi:hypothetical protein